MKKMTIGFSIFLILVSLIGARLPNSELSYFMTVNDGVTAGRLGLAFLLLLATLTDYFRNERFAGLLQGIGIGMFGILGMSLFVGDMYLLPIDYFVLIEGAVLAISTSHGHGENTLPAEHTVFSLRYQQLLETKPGAGYRARPQGA